MKTLKYAILFCLLVQVCFAQDTLQNKFDTNSNIIRDYFPRSPYSIINKDSLISFPDSLGGKSLHGHVYIEILVDDKSNIYEVDILKISLFDKKDRETLEYNLTDKQKPQKLLKYSHFFEWYCKKSLKVKKVGTPNKYNPFVVPYKIE